MSLPTRALVASVAAFRHDLLHLQFLDLATGSMRSLQYDPDPHCKLHPRLMEETISISP